MMKIVAKYYLPMKLPIGKDKGFWEVLKKLLIIFIIFSLNCFLDVSVMNSFTVPVSFLLSFKKKTTLCDWSEYQDILT